MKKVRKNKSNVYCSVPQCNTYYSENVSFHTFPLTNKRLCSEWVRVLKIGKKVSRYMRICSKHFKEQDFFFRNHVNQRCILKKGVIPSENLPIRKHDTTLNEKLVVDRCKRAELRAELRQQNATTSTRSKNQVEKEINIESENILNNIENRNIGNYDENTLTAAENLVLFSEGEKTRTIKCFEDKGIQVNTYEECNVSDVTGLISNDYHLQVMCGITSMSLLNVLVQLVMHCDSHRSKFSAKKKIMLAMFKIKLDLSYRALGVLFNISATTAKTYFRDTLLILSSFFKSTIRFPDKEEILHNMPAYFANYRNTRIVLDCTEIQIQKSKCLKCRLRTYSHYKGCHTCKFLIGVTPSGLISYVSRAYGGRASDKAICLKENLLEKLDLQDGVMVDKGFYIEKECSELYLQLIRPPFLRKRPQLSKEDAIKTAEIARARVHIERVIQRLKIYKTCKNVVPWVMLPFIEHVMYIVVGLTNLSSPILAENKFQ